MSNHSFFVSVPLCLREYQARQKWAARGNLQKRLLVMAWILLSALSRLIIDEFPAGGEVHGAQGARGCVGVFAWNSK